MEKSNETANAQSPSGNASPPEQSEEILRFLSQTHRSLHDQRRQYEFRVLLSALTFYALAGAVRFSKDVEVPANWPFKFACWILFFGVASITASLLRQLHLSNQTNKMKAERAELALEEFVYGKEKKSEVPVKSSQWEANYVWQAALLFTFASASAALLTSTF